MALPTAVSEALSKVNRIAESLRKAGAEVDAARKYGDDARRKNADDAVKKFGNDLAEAAKKLEEKAKKV